MNEPRQHIAGGRCSSGGNGLSGGRGITFGDTPSWYAVQLLWCYGQGETQRQHTDKTQLIRSLNLSATHIISKADASKRRQAMNNLTSTQITLRSKQSAGRNRLILSMNKRCAFSATILRTSRHCGNFLYPRCKENQRVSCGKDWIA